VTAFAVSSVKAALEANDAQLERISTSCPLPKPMR
jgi:hypothetical protein